MLDDKYRIDHLLAVGGMGAVYAGTHVGLRKRVAIKVINPELSNPQVIERFHREAITASQIGHEGIAQVTDIGTSTSGEPFLVMEFLEGESLGTRLKTSGPMPIEIACELGCAILSPLAAAHHAGIVHRDLKPDNVFLVRQSRGEAVKLLDFGISRASGLEQEFRLTTTGLVLGTPYYMSPEQARGEGEITTAADLYGVGVILYEMLCGTIPIKGDNYNQLMYRVMSGEYVKPRVRRPDLPLELEQIIVRAMSLQPAQRPTSATELEQALLPHCRPTFRENMIERISSPGMSFKTPLEHPPAPRLGNAPPAAQRASRRGLVIALVAIALVVGGIIALSVGGSSPPPKSDEPAIAKVEPTVTPITPVPEPPKPPAPTEPAADSKITLRFMIDPADAKITIDGAPVKGTELTVERDTGMHELRIGAPGYVAHVEKIRYDETQRISIELKHVTRTTRPPKAHDRSDTIDSQSPYQ